MKKLINNIIQTGVDNDNNPDLSLYIRLTNIVTIITSMAGIPYIILSLLMNDVLFAGIVSGYSTAILLTLYFNKVHKYNLARLWFFLLVNFGLGTNTLYFGVESGIQFLYLLSASLPFVLFRDKEKYIVLSVVIAGLCFFIFQTELIPPVKELSDFNLSIIYYTSLSIAFIWNIFNFFYITDRNQKALSIISKQNETINNALDQKDLLLKELHHRVKNNLQVVVSLLNLQSNNIHDEEFKKIFEESAGRIRSMSLVHEHLYANKDFSKISLEKYVKKLIEEITGMHLPSEVKYSLDLKVDDVSVQLNQAVPLGMIINEVITNSFKHSIIDNRIEISLSIQKENDGIVKMEIGDNGKGFDYHKASKESETLGLMLINDLTEQLNGNLYTDIGANGTNYLIEFKG